MFPINWQRMYHVGIVVPDLEAAMEELGTALGLSWPSPQSRTRTFRGPAGCFGAELRFVFSRQGPPYLELIEGVAGTPWEPGTGIHHIGIWVDDLEDAATRLAEAGAPIEVTYDTPSLESFTYHQVAGKLRVELVDIARRDVVEAWIREG